MIQHTATRHPVWLRPLRAAIHVVLTLVLLLVPAAQGFAQRRVAVVGDAEIETLVRDYARPIFKAAGLSKAGVDIILVNDLSFNAFVVGRRMFINLGAILTAETPNEIIGVIAHEAGHIAGGHQQRLRQQLEKAKTIAIITGLLGAGAVAAGAASGNSDAAKAGTGLVLGGAQFAKRNLLAYQRNEEATADRSAITYLERTGQSGRGMLQTFERFQSALSLTGARVDPYKISHPLPLERIRSLQTLVNSSRFANKKDSATLQRRHDMARAKIAAYTGGPSAVARLARSGLHPAAVAYGDAIATYQYGSPAAALKKIDKVLASQPKSAYLHEMRGEILIKANRPGDAVASLRKAVKLNGSKSGDIQVLLGRAYLLAGGEKNLRQAVKEITQGIGRKRENASAYVYLAQAYGQLGLTGDAELATAEHHYYSGRRDDARLFAARAQTRFKKGSPQWLRAQDIISAKR